MMDLRITSLAGNVESFRENIRGGNCVGSIASAIEVLSTIKKLEDHIPALAVFGVGASLTDLKCLGMSQGW